MINMRLFSPLMSHNERLRQEEFANRILAIGEGHNTINEIITWPLDGIIPDNTTQSLATAIYPTLGDPKCTFANQSTLGRTGDSGREK